MRRGACDRWFGNRRVARDGGRPRAAFDPPTTRPVFDPQTTNVPYLAWRGEEVRLVKCEPFLGDIPDPWAQDGSTQFDASWIVEDWSGDSITPSLEPSTVKFIDEQNPNGLYYGKHCVKADFVSQKAGMAMIKLVISDAATGHPLVKHQFLVGWLTLNKVSLDDGSGGTSIFDAPGWGTYNWLRARVTGTLPLRGFSDLYCPAAPNPPTEGCLPGLPDAIQLPAENPGSPPAGQGDTTTWWDDIAMRARRHVERAAALSRPPVADVGHPRRHERARRAERSRGRQRRRRRGACRRRAATAVRAT